jgi:hypothetical protein
MRWITVLDDLADRSSPRSRPGITASTPDRFLPSRPIAACHALCFGARNRTVNHDVTQRSKEVVVPDLGYPPFGTDEDAVILSRRVEAIAAHLSPVELSLNFLQRVRFHVLVDLYGAYEATR